MNDDLRTAADRLAREIRLASWLGKNSLTSRGRELAYRIKAVKISAALLHCPEFFTLELVERSRRHGVLILVRLPDGTGCHAPIGCLTDSARAFVYRVVVGMIESSAGQAEPSTCTESRKRAA